jgi:starch synthase
MSKKLYYITTEISPFTTVSTLSKFSGRIPLFLQEKGHDIRTIIPKYGYVSERKYILREVIRLRDIPLTFNGEEHSTSAKSAFIPKTRVQVYFLEDENWFLPLTNLLYKAKNGRVLADNSERYAFYSKAVLSTLPHLFWVPDIFICNSWQSALVPSMYKKHFKDTSDFYKGIKSLLVIHDFDKYSEITREDLEKAEVSVDSSLKGDVLNVYEVAAFETDAIVIIDNPSRKISTDLIKLNGLKANIDKISIIEVENEEKPNFHKISEEMDKIILKL